MQSIEKREGRNTYQCLNHKGKPTRGRSRKLKGKRGGGGWWKRRRVGKTLESPLFEGSVWKRSDLGRGGVLCV